MDPLFPEFGASIGGICAAAGNLQSPDGIEKINKNR
jgi:hypothetical protein